MKYSIVISTKDRPEALKTLVNSIELYTQDFEVIIHDDEKKHLSIANAWNECIEKAKGEFIQVLNDDMEVAPRWLAANKELYEQLEQQGNNPGVIQSAIMSHGQLQSRGGAFHDDILVTVPAPDEVKQIDYSNTPFMRKSVWEKVGGFTTHADMYYEDADFGLSCLKHGYTNWYNPASIIYHSTLGQLESDGEKEVKRRSYNESVVQKQARESFIKKWKEWLLHEHKNLY